MEGVGLGWEWGGGGVGVGWGGGGGTLWKILRYFILNSVSSLTRDASFIFGSTVKLRFVNVVD